MTVLSRRAATARLSTTYHTSSNSSNIITSNPLSRATTLRTSALTTSSTPLTSIRTTLQGQQIRHATFLPRPKRPYTFTQLVRLSDGSVYTHRTTSPVPLYTSQKDARNTLLWNPSSEALANVESDTAGRLAAFRQRFGRGWDAADGASEEVGAEAEELEEGFRAEQAEREAALAGAGGDGAGGLMDLISEASDAQTGAGKSKVVTGAIKKQRDGGKKRR